MRIIRTLLDNQILLYGIFAVGLIGFISRIILTAVYRRLLKEAENMGNSSKNLFVQMKKKYENSIIVNREIRNPDVFVEKYLRKYQAGGVTLKRMASVTYEMMLCAIIMGCIGGVGAFFCDMKLSDIVLYPAAAVLVVMLLLFCETFLEVEGKMELLRLTIIDYLENTMYPRIQMRPEEFYSRLDSKRDGKKEGSQARREAVEAFPAAQPEGAAREVSVAMQFESAEEEELVQQVLEEYLT